MNDFLREIQEDIERQKWLALWERFGRFIIGAAIALLALVAGWKAWQAYMFSANEKATSVLIQAADTDSAETYASAANELSGNHAALAKLLQAAVLVKTDPKAAESLYREVAAVAADPALVSLAGALGSPGEIDSTDAFYFSALERKGWQAIEAKDFAAARERFSIISKSPQVPQSLKSRASQVLAWLETQDVPPAK